MRPNVFTARLLAPAFVLLAVSSTLTGCDGCGGKFVDVGGKLVATPIMNGMPVTPARIDLGPVAIGTVTVVPVQVKNVGRGKVTVESIALETGSEDVVIAQVFMNSCDDKARPDATRMEIIGSTCATFAVRYGPHAQVALNDKIIITSNDPHNKKLEIPITGNGVGGTIRVCNVGMDGAEDQASCFPAPATMPSTVQFGDVAVGRSIVRTVRVFNDGQYDLKLSDAHIEADYPDFSLIGGSSLSPVVAPGESLDLQVQFKPMTNHEESGVLVIPSNDAVNPSVAVPLHGTAQGPELCITPNPLDFGTVPKGSVRTLQLTLTNCGNADFDIEQFSLVNDDPAATVFTTPAAGATNALPTTFPLPFPTGAAITIDVIYKPIYIETPPNPGDSGYFSIKTTYQRATVPVTGRGGFPGCDENGMNLTPTGVIVVKDGTRVVNPATDTFEPLTNVTLDGSTSTAPAPERITQYKWRIVSQPMGSVTRLIGSGSKVTIYTEIVGDYVVELVVGTGDMCQSAPVTTTLHVISRAAIHVQVTWPQAYGDVDLHYVGPGGTLTQINPVTDIEWHNSLATAYGTGTPSPTGATIRDFWGLNNACSPNGTTSDDASLDVDQRSGYGPENITHNRPFDGTYRVAIHYYCNGSGTTVTTNVNIFINGALAWHGSMPGMTTRQVWDAANIVVSNNGTSITVVPLTTPLYTISQGC